MLRIRKGYIVLGVMMLCAVTVYGQQQDRKYLRSGNKFYRDSTFVKAEVDYQKALDQNPNSADAMYNLGNAMLMQQKAQDAMKQYAAAARVEKDKKKLAEIYHNMGVILQSSKQYPQCIEAYKKALRNNPKDDETRYNLALAQKMLKDQQQQQQNQDKQQKQDQKQDDKQQNKDQQDQNKKDQQNPQQNPQQKNQDQMSKENAEQLLKAAMQDEKNVQDKVKKAVKIQGRKLEKDW